MSHAPFISAAGPEFFGLDSYASLSEIKEVKDIFEGPRYAKWRALRESEDSKYLALTMPRFLSRLPYDSIEIRLKLLITMKELMVIIIIICGVM